MCGPDFQVLTLLLNASSTRATLRRTALFLLLPSRIAALTKQNVRPRFCFSRSRRWNRGAAQNTQEGAECAIWCEGPIAVHPDRCHLDRVWNFPVQRFARAYCMFDLSALVSRREFMVCTKPEIRPLIPSLGRKSDRAAQVSEPARIPLRHKQTAEQEDQRRKECSGVRLRTDSSRDGTGLPCSQKKLSFPLPIPGFFVAYIVEE